MGIPMKLVNLTSAALKFKEQGEDTRHNIGDL
jgi:hypothetical protein